MYARTVDEYPEPLDFGVSGKLIMNALVMFDRQTDTLWSQLLGEAVKGKLAGAKLETLAATQTTWDNWQKLHPDTEALAKGYAGARDSYAGYYQDRRAGILGETNRDERLPGKSLGVGLVVNGQPAYYPYSELMEVRAVNDTVAGQPLLVVYQRDVSTALVFDREVDDQVLNFRVETVDPPQFILKDTQTESRWVAWNGSAVAGPLQGKSLQRVPATSVFWFAWSDFHPDTYVYGISAGPAS